LPSEVFANCICGKAMSITAFFNRVAATIMTLTFLLTADAIGWPGFLLLRSIEDMSRYFAEITNDTSVLEAEARIWQRQDYISDKEEMEMTETQECSSASLPGVVT
jgi:hypothetical protein